MPCEVLVPKANCCCCLLPISSTSCSTILFLFFFCISNSCNTFKSVLGGFGGGIAVVFICWEEGEEGGICEGLRTLTNGANADVASGAFSPI